MQTYDPLQERIDELEGIVDEYKKTITELEEKLKDSEQDSENYHDALVDIYNRLKRVI